MKKTYAIIAIFTTLLVLNVSGQRKRKSLILPQHEFGFNAGISNFQSDFHPKGPLDGLLTINGFSINATHSVHILPKSYRGNFFIKRLILKTSLGFTAGSFNNYGKADGNEPFGPVKTDNDVLLAKLTSKTSIISANTQLEFYLNDLVAYMHKSRRRRGRRKSSSKTNPYLALGVGVNYVTSTPTYDSEAIALNLYPDNYDPEKTIEGINTLVFSTNLSIGTRYKINRSLDLVTELRVTYYLSDRIDGVNPDLQDVSSLSAIRSNTATKNNDKFNDYNSTLSLGVIYHLF